MHVFKLVINTIAYHLDRYLNMYGMLADICSIIFKACHKHKSLPLGPILKHVCNVTLCSIIFKACHKHNSLQACIQRPAGQLRPMMSSSTPFQRTFFVVKLCHFCLQLPLTNDFFLLVCPNKFKGQ